MLFPLTNTRESSDVQLQLPVFSSLQVLVNVSPGVRTIPSGMVTSLTNTELLQLEDAEKRPPVTGIPAVDTAVEVVVGVGVSVRVGVRVEVGVSVGWAVRVAVTSVVTCAGTASVDCAGAANAILLHALRRIVNNKPVAVRALKFWK